MTNKYEVAAKGIIQVCRDLYEREEVIARPLRITFSSAFYHVTSRGNEQKAVFKSNRDRLKYLEYLETGTERYNTE